MAKVSVIVPIYNVEHYIERCVISLMEQTLDDIEYVFVNDCTPDKSIDILQDVIERYPNRIKSVKIHKMFTNSGQAAVRRHPDNSCFILLFREAESIFFNYLR